MRTSQKHLDPTIASMIFECRGALATRWGKRYAEKLSEYKAIIEQVRSQTRESILLAAQRIVKSLQQRQADPEQQMAFLAAAADMAEAGI